MIADFSSAGNSCHFSNLCCGVYSPSSGDSCGHWTFGGGVLNRSVTDVLGWSSPLRMSALLKVCSVAEETWMGFTVSPEKVAIHASTDTDRSNNIKYFPLRKSLNTDKQKAMAVRVWGRQSSKKKEEEKQWSLLDMLHDISSMQDIAVKTVKDSLSTHPMAAELQGHTGEDPSQRHQEIQLQKNSFCGNSEKIFALCVCIATAPSWRRSCNITP